MNTHASMYFGIRMSEQKEVRMFPPVPMVYEQVADAPLQWEYHVLTVDLREAALPSAEDLNELGSAGWLLAGSTTMQSEASFNPFDELGNVSRLKDAERRKVHYYFVRQKRA